MPANRSVTCLAVCCAAMLAYLADAAVDNQTELLIDELPQISQIGYGYSAMFSGSQFLPEPDSSELHTVVMGSQAPTNSPTLERIVSRGIRAVPSLLKHLDDARETRIPPLSGMMWISYADEYDYNHRLRKDLPTGVNKDTSGKNEPPSHTITIGDLCFVALGQIVNRNFSATRYQPTGGLVVSSPTYSKRLCAVVRGDFENLTEKTHRELLVQDFEMPDFEHRRIGACKRLAFYYPAVVEPLILKQLAVPTYDVLMISDFIMESLYGNKSPENRKALFDEFTRIKGPLDDTQRQRSALSDGILLRLFSDLALQEADEQGSLSPPLKDRYDPRALLIQLYGFTDAVSSTKKAFVTTWEVGEQTRFIRASASFQSPKIDEAVSGILAKISENDFLALACMERLIGRGYDMQIRNYCNRRIRESKGAAMRLQEMIGKLESAKKTDSQPPSRK